MLNEKTPASDRESINREGRVLVTALSRQFKTSQFMIPKDLDMLHSQGFAHRSHGEALLSEGVLEDYT
jgi:DeoR/GlpR family transcriptional regulator of sugar metabolism